MPVLKDQWCKSPGTQIADTKKKVRTSLSFGSGSVKLLHETVQEVHGHGKRPGT